MSYNAPGVCEPTQWVEGGRVLGIVNLLSWISTASLAVSTKPGQLHIQGSHAAYGVFRILSVILLVIPHERRQVYESTWSVILSFQHCSQHLDTANVDGTV